MMNLDIPFSMFIVTMVLGLMARFIIEVKVNITEFDWLVTWLFLVAASFILMLLVNYVDEEAWRQSVRS